MNQNHVQNQLSFTRDQITELISADAARLTELQAAADESSECTHLEIAVRGRLENILQSAHLEGLVDVLDLETQAANVFGAAPYHIHWGFRRLPVGTSCGQRTSAVELLTGDRLREYAEWASLDDRLGALEAFAVPTSADEVPWDLDCDAGERMFLVAELDRHTAPDLLEARAAVKAERAAADAATPPQQRRSDAERLTCNLQRQSDDWVGNGERELALLPVLELELADEELRPKLVAGAATHVEGLALALLENPLRSLDPRGAAFVGVSFPERRFCAPGSLTREILDLDLPHARRARAALEAAYDAAAASRRAQAAIQRSAAQGVLAHLGLGAIRHVDPARLAGLTPRELVELTQAVTRAYPKASLAGGFCYLVGKPASFDEFWERFRADHDPLVTRLEYWAASRSSKDSEEWDPRGALLDELPLDEVTAILTEGIVAAVELSLHPEQETVILSRALALSVAGSSFHEEILSFVSTDVEADEAVAFDETRPLRERAEAHLRLAGFLVSEVEAGPVDENSPFLTSELHLRILRRLPLSLRITLLLGEGTHQSTWRKMFRLALDAVSK